MNDSTPSQAQNPSNAGRGRLTAVFGAIKNIVLGEADPAPRSRAAARAEVEGDLMPSKAPKGNLIANALADAIGKFRIEEVIPYRAYTPEEVYQVQQVCIIETAENIALLSDFGRQRRDQRARMVKAVFKDFPEFDLSQLAEVRIVQAASNEQDPVCIVAGHGPQRARIAFEFLGEFVNPAEQAAEATHYGEPTKAAKLVQRPSQVGTVLPQPAIKPSGVATVLPPASDKAAKPVTLVLHISEPGKPERSVSHCNFPVRIGRSEESDVVVEHAPVSRTHIVIVQDASSGHLRVVDQSRVGTLLGTRALAKGEEVSLADGAVLTLAPTDATGNVVIRVDVPRANVKAEAKPDANPYADLDIMQARAPARGPAQADVPAPRAYAQTVFTGKAGGGAPATLLARHQPTLYIDSIEAKPIARVHLLYGDGARQVQDITELPFDIGRAPEQDDNSACVSAAAPKVSRQHLRITKFQAGAFTVQNLAVSANGTWGTGEKLGARFTLLPCTPGAPGSKDGTVILGERSLGQQSVAVSLELLK